jgi:hypothetical protein
MISTSETIKNNFYDLPSDIIRHIYEYDNTYREMFTQIVVKDSIFNGSWLKFIQKRIVLEKCDTILIDSTNIVQVAWKNGLAINLEFALKYFVEKYTQYFDEEIFPDEITIRVINYVKFTNISFYEKECDYFLTYRVYSKEQELLFHSDMKRDNKYFKDLFSNENCILFEYNRYNYDLNR